MLDVFERGVNYVCNKAVVAGGSTSGSALVMGNDQDVPNLALDV